MFETTKTIPEKTYKPFVYLLEDAHSDDVDPKYRSAESESRKCKQIQAATEADLQQNSTAENYRPVTNILSLIVDREKQDC